MAKPHPNVPNDLSRRQSLLAAALGFALVDTKGKPAPKEVQLVREGLDNWRGLGDPSVTGMNRQGYPAPPHERRGVGVRRISSSPDLYHRGRHGGMKWPEKRRR